MLRPSFVSTATGAIPFICRIKPQPPHRTAVSLSALPTLPTLLTSVKVFDGSEITDAVVVSDTFWSTLSSKLPYLILSQLLASITFVIIASLLTAQGKFLFDQISSDENEAQTKGKNNQFRKANEPPPPPLDFTKLFLCVCIDIIGSANEVIPLVGELVDVVYAPVAALLLRQLFSGSNIVFLLEFAEEILPFTDILPLATICWVVESFFGDGRLAQALKIGKFSSERADSIVDEYKFSPGRAESFVDRDGKGKDNIIDAEIENTNSLLKSEERRSDE
mmetsp:Transcript_25784/g.44015  ORF Transcript_25784/g.44015 Transcript_25784/m.44015 type:complete len:278 (+) Transcript_25784:73-906(+)